MLNYLHGIQPNILLVFMTACVVVAVLTLLSNAIPPERRRILFLFELCAALLLLFDRFAYLYRGDPSNTGYWMVRISNFMVFFMTLAMLERFNAYIADLAVNEGGHIKVPAAYTVSRIILAVGTILLIISQFTGLYYTFDETNTYQRAPGFIISYIIPITVFVISFVMIIRMRKMLRKPIFIPLVLFTVMPLIASVAQVFLYGLSLTNISMVSVAILLYIFAFVDMNRAAEKAHELEIEMLKEENELIEGLFDEMARAFVKAIDAKDEYTQGHSNRVAEYSRMLAEAAGMDEKTCNKIYYSALLHDVGKIGIPLEIINKKGKLTEEEYEQMKQHTIIGGRILASITEFPYISVIAQSHHEWYDGSGYPEGLKGEDIPEIGRLVAVADAYDAMTSRRSYREPFTQERVRSEIENGLGTQFDPEYGKVMLKLIDKDKDFNMRDIS